MLILTSVVSSGRRPWFNKFRAELGQCETVDAIEKLLRAKVQRWRGLSPLSEDDVDADGEAEDSDADERTERRASRDSGEGTTVVDDMFSGLSILP